MPVFYDQLGSLLGAHLETILRAVLSKMQSAQTPTIIQVSCQNEGLFLSCSNEKTGQTLLIWETEPSEIFI